MSRALHNQKGLTLIEILVAMAINLIILAGVVSVYITQQRSYSTEKDSINMQQESRQAFTVLVRELRMIGYVADGTGLFAQSAITDASADKITFLWDSDNDGTRETVTIRMTQAGDALYDPDNPRVIRIEQDGTTTTVKQIAEYVSSISFKYHTGSTSGVLNSPIADTSTQTARDSIRVITLTMIFRTKNPTPDSTQYRLMPITTVITPRNLRII